jgi:translation initiation factor 1 (eIF-1/SUI1)
MNEHPDLYEELYMGDEEVKATGKGKKGVSFEEPTEKKIIVLKMKRGGKKIQSVIIGLDKYGCNLADIAKVLSKRFATGAAEAETEH